MTPPEVQNPLTERVLASLPGWRFLWMAVWASLPFAQALGFDLLSDDADTVLNLDAGDLALACYLIVLSLWSVRLLTAQAMRLDPPVHGIGATEARAKIFDGLGSVAYPIALSAVFALLEVGESIPSSGVEVAALLPIVFLVHLPITTGAWVLIVILLSLDRLGRLPLDLDACSGDPNLGLKPAGVLAFRAFLVLTAGAAPVMLRYTTSTFALALNLPIVIVAVSAFLISLYRIHREMAAARTEALARARARHARALRPVLARDDLDTLSRHSNALMAAAQLEDRVKSVKTWPVTGGIVGQTVLVVISVVTGLISRAVTAVLGL